MVNTPNNPKGINKIPSQFQLIFFTFKYFSRNTNPYPANKSIPGVFVMAANPPNKPASQNLFFSKENNDNKINNINRLSGAPTDRTTKNRGKNSRTDAKTNGFFVSLNFLSR